MSENNSNKLTPCDNRTILIVDDEKQVREMFKLFVQTDFPDLDVELASNGAEAFKLFSEHHNGIILMDLHMPIMDGTEAFREIEDYCQEEDWEIPVIIFCTAYDAPSDTNRVLQEYPKTSLLKKPISNALLLDAVKKAMY